MIDPELLLRAYASGWFPMAQGADAAAPIEWFSPNPRGIVPLDTFRLSSRLARTMRRPPFDIAIDRGFEAVMRACGGREETWINEPLLQSYLELHRRGFAHSVETWQDGRLVGGLYGVSLCGAFFGESMFHTVTDASKVALVALVERLRARGYLLLDVQWVTPHLAQFGATAIARRRYLALLARAMRATCTFADEGGARS